MWLPKCVFGESWMSVGHLLVSQLTVEPQLRSSMALPGAAPSTSVAPVPPSVCGGSGWVGLPGVPGQARLHLASPRALGTAGLLALVVVKEVLRNGLCLGWN